jgi:hypothetical protein
MNTVAIFSTYGPSEGFGGPARLFHQRRVLEAAGWSVVHVVLTSSPVGGKLRAVDFVELVERPFRAPFDPIYDDVDLGRRAVANVGLIDRIVEHLRQHGVSVMMLEQPFLAQIAERVLGRHPAAVVYSSQNLEYRLRRDLEAFAPDWRRPTSRADEVRELESLAIRLADATTAICATDQKALADEFGCRSVLVPNGTSVADRSDVRSPKRRFERPEFVFSGSSYWPNTDGLARIATPSLAFLPPDVRLHLVGSVCHQVLELPALQRHLAVNASRLVLHGFLPIDALIEQLTSARCVIVPVFIGEGSNLKSADALASGAPVIMTERATRGYEDLLAMDDEGVVVVDDASEFRLAMADQARRAPTTDTPVGVTRRAKLRWSARLAPLVDVFDRLRRA